MARVACSACGEVAGKGKRVGSKCGCGGEMAISGNADFAVLAKENRGLKAEIAALKKQLGEANAKLTGMKVVRVSPGSGASQRIQAAVDAVLGKNCGGPGRCGRLGCAHA